MEIEIRTPDGCTHRTYSLHANPEDTETQAQELVRELKGEILKPKHS